MKPRRRSVRLQGDRESVVILGMGIRLWESAGDVEAARLSAGISRLGYSPLCLAFVLVSALARFFRTSPVTFVCLF
jgi:hypothetical protein